ncbi:MAG: efflux RND transporter periplasmic adaptor subunit [Chloroflexi bacterium]|nr:efflux RND transporter periplasmic adaptor subunit [Chloroflexota bacterium]
MKKWIVGFIIIAATGYWGFQKRGSWTLKTESARLGSRPTTATVENRSINFTVNAAGDIGPAEQVSVRPEINGRIETLPVDIGDKVKKNDVLFTLDDKELQNQRSSSSTEIERARLQLDQSERNYKRAQQLFDENLISQELFENTKTEYELAKNALERAQKELLILDERLTKTKITAPFDCTILTRPISMGQAVSGSGGFNSGTEVLTIADLNEMIINAHINQADVTRLQVDQEVEVQIEAVAGLTVTGRVERIAPQATIKNNIKGFAVRILLKDVDERVRPGMTANIKIPVSSVEDVLAVPLAAVFTEKNPETGMAERFVYIKKAESYERRPVQIGISDFFFAEVQSGLSSGEVVCLELPPGETANSAAIMPGGDRATALGSPRPAVGASPSIQPGGSRPAGTTSSAPARVPAGSKSGGSGRNGTTGTRPAGST